MGKEGDLVLAMAYLGLRWSELAALRVSDVDVIRRRVRIVERVTEVGGRRETFGSLARSAGADLRWIQRAMGHESINTTARSYAHLCDNELDIVAAALDRLSGDAGGTS
jgi:integrase